MEFQGFHLVDGRYQNLEPDAAGRLWCESLSLLLGIHEEKLRFFTSNGTLVMTPGEDALKTQLALAQEQQRTEQERQRADRLADRLRELGLDHEV